MKALGALVTRSAGSKGLWDVTAVFPKSGEVWLIQVKYCRGAWVDKNWRELEKITPSLPAHVIPCAFVFQPRVREPAYHVAGVFCRGSGVPNLPRSIWKAA